MDNERINLFIKIDTLQSEFQVGLTDGGGLRNQNESE